MLQEVMFVAKTIDANKGLVITMLHAVVMILIIAMAIVFLFLQQTGNLEKIAYFIGNTLTP